MPRTGSLKHRVTIQAPTETQAAGSGALVATWSTFCSRWGEIITSGGREFVAASAVHGEITHLVKMRGYAAVTSKMRAVVGARIFEILAAYSPDGRDVSRASEVHLACRDLGERLTSAEEMLFDSMPGNFDDVLGNFDSPTV